MLRQFAPGALEARDLLEGRLEANFVRVLTRLLAAHAMAERLTATGYHRALEANIRSQLVSIVRQSPSEEHRHAQLIYDALAELGVSPVHADRLLVTALKGPSFAAPRHFAEHPAGEIDLVMANVSLDMTGLIMIGVNYKDSSYAPHARAAEIILADEEEHELFASNVLGEAAERLGIEAVNQGLRQWLPRAVNFFGPPGSGFTYDCLRYGLKSRDNGELSDLYLSMVERRVQQAGLTMPVLSPNYPHTLV